MNEEAWCVVYASAWNDHSFRMKFEEEHVQGYRYGDNPLFDAHYENGFAAYVARNYMSEIIPDAVRTELENEYWNK